MCKYVTFLKFKYEIIILRCYNFLSENQRNDNPPLAILYGQASVFIEFQN